MRTFATTRPTRDTAKASRPAIACLRAAARRATLIDSSADALVLAERETAANDVHDRCRFVVANVFDELRKVRDAGTHFDLIIGCDSCQRHKRYGHGCEIGKLHGQSGIPVNHGQ